MISFPYTSVKKVIGNVPTYDRAINSEIKRAYNKLRYTQGIAPDSGNGFQVVADTGMNVKVLCDGAWAHVGGDFCYEKARERVLTVQAADETYDRIDAVVIRNNISTSVRAADLYIVQGTPASAPKMPDLTNTPEIQEICLATVFVQRNAVNISQNKISDTRLDPALCGVLANAFGEVDTKQFFAQLKELIKELEEELKKVKNGSAYMLSSVYDSNHNGIVDDSEQLGGLPAESYMTKSRILDLFYPIGTYYQTDNESFNPNEKWGGTWEKLEEGRFLVSAGNNKYHVGNKGGEETHTLTVREMPEHRHGIKLTSPVDGPGGNNLGGTPTMHGVFGVYSETQGHGEAHNNMPPYLAVYIWKRTA